MNNYIAHQPPSIWIILTIECRNPRGSYPIKHSHIPDTEVVVNKHAAQTTCF